MKRLAFCIIGQLRTFKFCADNLHKLLIGLQKHYKIHLYFYISFKNTIAHWKKNHNKHNYLLYEENINNGVNITSIDDFIKIIDNFKVDFTFLNEDDDPTIYSNIVYIKILECRKKMIEYLENINKIDEYDMFFFTRPDLIYNLKYLNSFINSTHKVKFRWDFCILMDHHGVNIFKNISEIDYQKSVENCKNRQYAQHSYYIKFMEKQNIQCQKIDLCRVLHWDCISVEEM